MGRSRQNFTHVTAQRYLLGTIFTYRVSHEKRHTSSGAELADGLFNLIKMIKLRGGVIIVQLD